MRRVSMHDRSHVTLVPESENGWISEEVQKIVVRQRGNSNDALHPSFTGKLQEM